MAYIALGTGKVKFDKVYYRGEKIPFSAVDPKMEKRLIDCGKIMLKENNDDFSGGFGENGDIENENTAEETKGDVENENTAEETKGDIKNENTAEEIKGSRKKSAKRG